MPSSLIFLIKFGKFNDFYPPQDSARQLTHLQSCLFFLCKAFAAEDNAAASAMLIFSLLYCTFQMGNLQSQNSKHTPEHFLANTLNSS